MFNLKRCNFGDVGSELDKVINGRCDSREHSIVIQTWYGLKIMFDHVVEKIYDFHSARAVMMNELLSWKYKREIISGATHKLPLVINFNCWPKGSIYVHRRTSTDKMGFSINTNFIKATIEQTILSMNGCSLWAKLAPCMPCSLLMIGRRVRFLLNITITSLSFPTVDKDITSFE